MSARALQSSRDGQSASRGREVTGIILLSFALFLGISFISLLFSSGTWLGPGGAAAATALYSVLGLGGLVVPYVLARSGARVLAGRPVGLKGIDPFGAVLAVVAACVLLDVLFHDHRLAGYTPGGMLGESLAQICIGTFYRVGTALVALSAIAVGLVLASQVSFRRVGGWITDGCSATVSGIKFAGASASRVFRVMLPTKDELFGRAGGAPKPPKDKEPRKRKKTPAELDAEAVPVEIADPKSDQTV